MESESGKLGNHKDPRGGGFSELLHRRLTSSPHEGQIAHDAPAPAANVAVIACYGGETSAPMVETVEFTNPATFIDVVSMAVMNCVATTGGSLGDELVFELISNLIHADFADPVISVLDGGNTIRVTDTGPGIPDREAALRPGFTSATYSQRRVIRGAGAGLPLAKQLAESSGGFLILDDNIGGGTVVTASALPETPHRYRPAAVVAPSNSTRRDVSSERVGEPAVKDANPAVSGGGKTLAPPNPTPQNSIITSSSSTVRGVPLSERQREVLAVVAESVEAGPSTVSTLLSIPLSTAFRDLRLLEDRGLVSSLDGGKRQVTGMGIELLRIH